MSIVKCPFCGGEISEKAIKCPRCNANLKKYNNMNKKGIECAECGNIYDLKNDSCPNCGCPNRIKNSRRKKIILIIVCFIIVTVIAVACLIFINSNKTNDITYDRKYSLKEKLYDAAIECESVNANLSNDGLSLTIDSSDKNDEQAACDILMVINKLGLPDYISEEMKNTNALMGKQSETYDGIEVSWSYHPDNGLDVVFKIVQ